jgi:hypothetical protein
MKKIKLMVLFGFFATTISVLFSNCTNGFSVNPAPSSGGAALLNVNLAQANVVAVTTGCGYVNEPCVTVTICTPGSVTNCQTIPNVLLDTGSYGLRLFANVSLDGFVSTTPLLSLQNLPDPSNPSNFITECVSYADNSSDVGPVALADVSVGGEKAQSLPIQIIDSTFANMGSPCESPDQSPLDTGFNGILGVGLFSQDCGVGCTASMGAPISGGPYYTCPGGGASCSTNMTVELNQQVTNPVAYLPVDNNGVILYLPAVPDAGAGVISGYLVFGIGTEANNIPVGATAFQADDYGNFITNFNGVTSSSSFIDSGSNGLYFADSSLPNCTQNSGFYCPSPEVTLSGIQQGANGYPSQVVAFNVADGDYELSASDPNITFNNLGGQLGSSDFDWGLPFFLGRTVFVGMDTASSSLGSGPLWAY